MKVHVGEKYVLRKHYNDEEESNTMKMIQRIIVM